MKAECVLPQRYAGVAELADAPDLGSGGRPCRFNSCHPHYSKKSGRPWKYKVSYFFVYFSAIWGTGFYKTMSRSLKEEFPRVSGFSVTNLKYIKRFFEFYKSDRYFWISVVKGSSEGDWKFTSFNRGDQEVIEGYCRRVKQDKHETRDRWEHEI